LFKQEKVMALQVLNGPIIAAGEALSDGLDCRAGQIVRLTMPAGWTPANLSFQISTDGQGYNDLVSFDGQEVVMPVVPGSAVVVAPLDQYLRAVAFLKIRSGSRTRPVVQEAQRDFAVAIETP
jgi:hypothetical protein